MVKIELEIERIDKDEIFYKPNQLISIDRNTINRTQCEGMNILLKKAQDFIHYNTRLITGEEVNPNQLPMSDAQIYEKMFGIDIDDFLNLISLKIYKKNIHDVIALLRQLKDVSIESFDKNEYVFTCIFQKIEINIAENIIRFQLSTDLAKSFINKNSIIGTEIEDKIGSNGKNYTHIPLLSKDKIKTTKLHDYSYYMYEELLKYVNYSKSNIFQNGNDFYKKYTIVEFKSLIGMDNDKYPKPSDLNKFVLKKIKLELEKVGVFVNIEIIGRGKYAEFIKFIILPETKVVEFMITKNKREDFRESRISEGILELSKILEVRFKNKDNINKLLYDVKYDKYVEVMKKLELEYVSEEFFSLGYRYLVN